MKYILYLLLLLTSYAYGQKSYDISERKGQLFFKVSSEYRVTPIWRSVPRDRTGSFVEINEQNSGVALSYAFDWFIAKNWSLGFSHSLRYDHILVGPVELENSTIEAVPDENALLMDFHFYFQYHFKVFQESELYLQAGRSILHVGSSFNFVTRFDDANGQQIGALRRSLNNNFGAWNLGIGWKKNKIEILGGAYTSDTTEYFEETVFLWIPYIRFSYNLGKL